MKIFKQLLRKSLNLIQGMEMMNQVNLSSIFTILELYPLFIIQGYMQAVGGVGRGGGHGELDHYLSIHCNPLLDIFNLLSSAGLDDGEESPAEATSLSSALCKRSSFIALRRAIYSSTIQVEQLEHTLS